MAAAWKRPVNTYPHQSTHGTSIESVGNFVYRPYEEKQSELSISRY
jgi:hypothetical protein